MSYITVNMPALTTPQAHIGLNAPDFKLLATDGHYYTRDEVMGTNGLVVMFICNHCPFVQAILPQLVKDCRTLKSLGIHSVAIMSNDTIAYPQDSYHHMQSLAKHWQFDFPYLYDETQAIATAYGAVCTPDFFGFDQKLRLQYRGRLDNSGRNAAENSERELLLAMKDVATHGQTQRIQHPSIGCSIKWTEGESS